MEKRGREMYIEGERGWERRREVREEKRGREMKRYKEKGRERKQ